MLDISHYVYHYVLLGKQCQSESIQQPTGPPGFEFNEEELDSLKELIKRTSIEHNYQKLHSALEDSLEELAKLLLEGEMVPRHLVHDPSYYQVMNSVLSSFDLAKSVTELEKSCGKFIKALDKVGGPARLAAISISDKLKKNVKEEFRYEFHVPKLINCK